ncbi:MAG: hypothetical protein JXA54_15370 [Candidatus Heimdallarchaeota archaeon]|nr:hypothetical protein [Candidatus Heimdallarchaeota archaeon]
MPKKDKKQIKEELAEKTASSIKGKKKKTEKKDKKTRKTEMLMEKKEEIENNLYTILFDELISFSNVLPHMNPKAVKQQLILLDGKMLWLEKASEENLLHEEGSEDIIDMEMQILEKGYDLETADEMKDDLSSLDVDFDLESFKADLEESKSLGDSLRELINEVTEDDPLEDLTSKFVLYDLRAILERAVKEVFRLEGKIKKLADKEDSLKEVEQLQTEQKKATKNSLREMMIIIKKEKPRLILDEEKIIEFKNLTSMEIVELKAKEEKEMDRMVTELMK